MNNDESWLERYGVWLFWGGLLVVVLAWSPVSNVYHKYHITCVDQAEHYNTSTVNDPTAPQGEATVITKGEEGVKHVCTQGDGKPFSTTETKAPVDAVTSVGTKEEPTTIYQAPVTTATSCPITTCADGSCSNSTGRGTCSHHGGEAY